MKLKTFINNVDKIQSLNIKVPLYNIEEIRENTKKNPTWIHFGAGNIFRGYIAKIVDNLLNDKLVDTGIIAVDTHATGRDDDYEIVEKVYKNFDNLTLLALIHSNGNIDKRIIGSITDILHADFINYYDKLKEIFISKSLQVVSYTITEKGYSIKNTNGEYNKNIEEDINNDPKKSKNIISITTALLYERFKNGEYPLSLLSLDNCANNGDKLKDAVISIASEWSKKGFVENTFIEYLNNKVSYPLSMIDKITPRPSEIISKQLLDLGLEDMNIFQVGHNKQSGFVNAEYPEYLVIEDNFANGRMPLEKAGVFMTNRDTVQKTEKMKVTTCLNPLHTSLAIFGCLLNYNFIYEELQNPLLKKLIEKIGYEEGMKVVIDPKIINPKDFLKEVIEERLTNPFIPDSPKRIATDTSLKIPVRFGETIKSYIENNYDLSALVAIPLTISAWLRYLMAIDDNGEKMEISSDPMLEELQSYISKIRFKDVNSINNNLEPILSNKNIFGVNLYDTVLAKKIESYFKEMIENTGSVEKCLSKYIQ